MTTNAVMRLERRGAWPPSRLPRLVSQWRKAAWQDWGSPGAGCWRTCGKTGTILMTASSFSCSSIFNLRSIKFSKNLKQNQLWYYIEFMHTKIFHRTDCHHVPRSRRWRLRCYLRLLHSGCGVTFFFFFLCIEAAVMECNQSVSNVKKSWGLEP